MERHVHDLITIPEHQVRTIFEERKPSLRDLFVFFACKTCDEHLYMLKEDFETREGNLSNIQEHGAMFYFDKEANEWALLYTIIS